MFTSQATIERRAAKETRLQSIETRIATNEKANQQFHERISSLESQKPVEDDKAPLLLMIDELKADIHKIKEEYNTSQQKQAILQDKLDEFKKSLDSMSTEITELRKQLTSKSSATTNKTTGTMFQLPKKTSE